MFRLSSKKRIMIAKNNIFNIRAGRAQWLGMTGTCKGFVEFETREHGIRAWLVLMRNYRHKYGCRTIRQIVSRFAPPSENNTERYIRYCCQVVVVGDGADISQDIMYAMLGVAMARMETGVALDISEVREVMKKYHITIV